ncbi:MAG: sortase [Chloroflexota bacterium]
MQNNHRFIILLVSLVLIVGITVHSPDTAHAATLTVNSLNDVDDGTCDAAHCSLREAIDNAVAGDTITFSVTGTITLTGGELLIDNDLTITGPGADQLDISGNNSSRVFYIIGGTVTISALTIQDGKAPDGASPGTGPGMDGEDGGGIYHDGTTLTLQDCIVNNNNAGNGGNAGGIFSGGDGGDGGGIFNETTLIIENCTISNNQTGDGGAGNLGTSSSRGGNGGGIHNIGSLTIRNSSIKENTTGSGDMPSFWGGRGGGISHYGPAATIESVTFSGNNATLSWGGGLYNSSFSSINRIHKSTFSNNIAMYGGGISNNWGSQIDEISSSTFHGQNTMSGGGIFNDEGVIGTITKCAFSNNDAIFSGGAILNSDATIDIIERSEFSSNTAKEGGAINNRVSSTIGSITNSTFSGNIADEHGGGFYNDNSTVTIIAHNTFWDNRANYPLGGGGGSLHNVGGVNTLNTFSYNIIAYSLAGGNCSGTFPNTLTGNLTDTNGCWVSATSLAFTGHVGPLQDNGGPTKTHALLFSTPANPAIDAGEANCSPAPINDQDQRGVKRSDYGTACDIGAFEYTGSDSPLEVSESNPANGSKTPTVTQITVTFNKDVVSDGSPDAANNINNYLLVEKGPNGTFDTISCADGLQVDDVKITITGVTYDAASKAATLTFTPSPLPLGKYRLFVCGTTSIYDTIGLELNNGLFDTEIEFILEEATVSTVSNTLPATGFPRGMTTSLPTQPVEKAYASSDLVLEIPSLGVEMDIVGVSQSKIGWDTTWLGQSAGWLEGSAFPTWAGNTILTGHVWDANNNPGPFAQLKSLKYRDQIKIEAWGQTHIYEVVENKLVFPRSVSKVFEHEEYDYLTLLTCEFYNPLNGDYFMRRMVKAVLVSVH